MTAALAKVRRKPPQVRRKLLWLPTILDCLFEDWAVWRRLRGGRWEHRAAYVGMPFSHWVRVEVVSWERIIKREDYR